jgi:hypothetical protein
VNLLQTDCDPLNSPTVFGNHRAICNYTSFPRFVKPPVQLFLEGTVAFCANRSCAEKRISNTLRKGETSHRKLKRIVRRLYSLQAQIDVALRPMVGSMNEHVEEHRPAVWIVAALPGGMCQVR